MFDAISTESKNCKVRRISLCILANLRSHRHSSHIQRIPEILSLTSKKHEENSPEVDDMDPN
jgi:hypothetical protein